MDSRLDSTSHSAHEGGMRDRLRGRLQQGAPIYNHPQLSEDPTVVHVDQHSVVTSKNGSMFSEEVTEAEMAIIQQRVSQHQQQVAEMRKRQLKRKGDRVRQVFEEVVDEEVEVILNKCNQDEEEAIVLLTDPAYLFGIRREIACSYSTVSRTDEREQELVRRRQVLMKRQVGEETRRKQHRVSRLKLEDALQQLKLNPSKAMEGWSEARSKSYKMIDKNPNSYYYRFNAVGDVQKTGNWTNEERNLFYARLKELGGANGQWGIFSMTIPGRVGYQCSNFYRRLIEKGEVKDPNYYLDDRGKAHYLFDSKNADGTTTKVVRTHCRKGGSIPVPDHAINKRKRKSKRNGSEDDDASDMDLDQLWDEEDDSGTYTHRTYATTKRTRSNLSAPPSDDNQETTNQGDNPLPGFIDPITLEEVVKPAISPYGHVLGYTSWVRCLTTGDPKNTCPLSKKLLTKRQLVILTWDNIEHYRPKIANTQ